ncbi:MAG TPA: 2-C-methyl-D-erythritol 4-phosphate cytidylyltransferase [Gemmatimonadaceae bacterium]|nr:2-C-methyl-D-erythritol 4-phosphate cytidylyltransferase [Gemmatimonadaceae bacterium]
MTGGNGAAPDVGVVILAAGSGTRASAGELKQFRWVAGRPMLLHSVLAFQQRSDVGMVVCVLPRRYAGDPPPWLFQCDLERMLVSVGGPERGDSVANGLEDLPENLSVIAIHDAARPLVPSDVIERVIAQARTGTGAVPAIPVSDTLKRVGADGSVTGTVDRSGLWRAQTPQAFPREMIVRAYTEAQLAGVGGTDDAALCERLGLPVVIVPGSERAFKITEERDFARAEALAHLD